MERVKHQKNKDKFGFIFSRNFFASSSFALFMALLPHLSYSQENQNGKSEIEKEIILEVKQSYLQKFLGWRKSEEIEVDGVPHLLFQNGMVKKNGDSGVELVETANLIHYTGHDGELIKDLGVPPVMNPVAPNPRLIFNYDPPTITLPDSIVEFISKLDLGKSTSTGQIGEESIYRFEKGVLKLLPDGSVEPLPIGEVAAKLNLIPEEKLLAEPTDDPDVIPTPLFLLQHSYDKCGVNCMLDQWANLTGQSKGKVHSVIDCENPSRNPMAKNPTSTASGIFQETDSAISYYNAEGWDYWRDRFHPVRNAFVAMKMFFARGWRPWVCA